MDSEPEGADSEPNGVTYDNLLTDILPSKSCESTAEKLHSKCHEVPHSGSKSDCDTDDHWDTTEEAVYSDGTDSDEHQSHFTEQLAQWALDFNIPHTAITKLLEILRQHDLHVPNQATTLLQTQRKIDVQQKSGDSKI